MYWIYAILFLLAVAAPEAVREGSFGFSEEVTETLFVFLFGLVGFLLGFAKEKAILRHVREKMTLQREKTDMTKDLSESYSYIGAANRKLELVRNFVLSLPEAISTFRKGRTGRAFSVLSKEIRLLCQTDTFVLRIIDTADRNIVHETKVGKCGAYARLDAECLLASDRGIREEEGCLVVRSPGEENGLVAFLAFPKPANGFEDGGMLEVLATEGLLLVAFRLAVAPESSGERSET